MKYTVVLLFLLVSFKISAQSLIGIPQINTYTGLDHKGGTQNWDIDQDANGIMYFANNEGLLSFDGHHWKTYKLPNGTVVRSVKVHPDGKIYVGAQDEIGYFFPDENGQLKFNSIKNLIPENQRQFSDIWDIVITHKGVFFRSANRIFLLNKGKIKTFLPKQQWEYLGYVNGTIYAQDVGRGLFIFQNDRWQPIVESPIMTQDFVTAILPFSKDTVMISTLKHGLFLQSNQSFTEKPLSNEFDFLKNRIYSAAKINNDNYVLATSSAGCYIINKAGQVIQQFSSKEGLYKNNIRSVFMDRNKNLWLGLDDGINLVTINSAIKYIYPDTEKLTSSYSSLIKNDNLYIGTSNGIFYTPIQNNPDVSNSRNQFKEVKNSSGQIWSLKEINNAVVVGHEYGAFYIHDEDMERIYSNPPTWLFEQISSDKIVSGTYTGLNLLNTNGAHFDNKGKIEGFSESLRFLIHADNDLWSSHPYRGIFKFSLSSDGLKIIKHKIYGKENGLPSTFGNYVAKIKGKIVVAAKDGLYEYDSKNDSFKSSDYFKSIFGKETYHFLKEDHDGNVWFVSNKNIGVVDFYNGTKEKPFSIIHFPQLNGQVVAGFESIYPYNSKNILIGANTGLIHINYESYTKNINPINVVLSMVKASGIKDSIIYGGYFTFQNKIQKYQNSSLIPKLDKSFNSIQFEFSSTLYEHLNNIQFSYILEGFDPKWSSWDEKPEKLYTNIPKGQYTFKVKARNNLGNESEIVSYQFQIKPSWYESLFFYFLCFISIIFIMYGIITRQQKKYLRAQKVLQKQHNLEIELNKSEIIKLQNEKLESEVSFKNKELATASMNLVQKNKLLSKIKEGLMPITKAQLSEDHSIELKKVLRMLNEADKGEQDWEQFSVHFDQIHSNFLQRLKEKFPTLSQNDLKLCAYLKMNLSSKEIAQLLSITIRAVEVSRYRLRKKLHVPSETNLFDYLFKATSD